MELDIRTLIASTLLFSLIFGSALYYYTRRHTFFDGVSAIAVGLIGTGIGWGMLGLRDTGFDFITIALANTLILGAMMLTVRGTFSFYGVRPRWERPLNAVLLIGAFAALCYFTFIEPSVKARIITVAMVSILVCVSAIAGLRESAPGFRHLPVRGLQTAYILVGAYSLFRLLWTLNLGELGSFMHPGLVHALAVLSVQLLVLLTPFFIILSASDYLETRLSEQMRRDPLTGVYNRRALDDEVNRDIARSRRDNRPLCTIICDLDHFKQINDQFGHQYGDEVLKAAASVLQSGIRESDLLARFGGEEFVILLSSSTAEAGVAVAEKLRERVSELTVDGSDRGSPMLSASFGVSVLSADDDLDWQTLFRRADKAMYEAKRRGRNCVVLWSPEIDAA